MTEEKLTIEDFEEKTLEESTTSYFSYSEGDFEICLESLFDRNYAVGIYDDSRWLLAEKKFTNLQSPSKEDALEMAVRLANELRDFYKHNNIID